MLNDDPYRLVLDALRAHGCKVTETAPDTASTQCPVHDDRNASMTVSRGTKRPVVVTCHSNHGCGYDDVIAVLGLSKADLGEREQNTVWTPRGDAVAVYRYRDEAGQVLFDVCRTADKQFPTRVPDPTTKSGYRWRLGDTRRVPYRLPELVAAVAAGRLIHVTEGEKDANAIVAAGGAATCNPHGAGKWREDYNRFFVGARVRIVADNDKPGIAHAQQVTEALSGTAASVEAVLAKVGKDAGDHLGDGYGLDDFQPLVLVADEEFGDYMDPYVAPGGSDSAEQRESTRARRVDLKPWLDGTYSPPQPSVGGARADQRKMLYPGRWHTLIAPTTSGKSWWAVWHVVAELRAGRTVVYAHFEEADPGGTIDRIRMIAPDLTADDLIERFIWLDCTRRWKGPGEFAREIPQGVALAVLDGINAACAQHGWPVDKPEAVGEYRAHFAAPVIAAGGTPLSLGHPPKARDRQDERHGYGSTAWLDEVDGVGFRLKSSKESPIRRGRHGLSTLHVVKDRYGQVEQHCSTDERTTSDGWFYAGALHVDSSGAELAVYCSAPATTTGDAPARSQAEILGDAVIRVVAWEMKGRFTSARALETQLRAAGVTFRREVLDVALAILQREGMVTWPEVPARHPRPGVITDSGVTLAERLGQIPASQDQIPKP